MARQPAMMLLYGRLLVFPMCKLNTGVASEGTKEIREVKRKSWEFVAVFAAFIFMAAALPGRARGQAAGDAVNSAGAQLVWVDTDIGDDLDDAFALGLVMRSPELKVLGISTAFGDTQTRARLTTRFLRDGGIAGPEVTAGVHTETQNVMTQRAYAERSPAMTYPDGVAAMLAAIRQHPGEITLLAIGPLFNIGAAIDRDPATFKQLKRVVMMGGSIIRGYDGQSGEVRPADAEWNIKCDPKGAAKLLASGVPIFMAPLDSTQIHLDAARREAIFATDNPLTDQLTLLYHQWSARSGNHPATPTLFDPVAAAYIFRPDLCPMEPMRLMVDEQGFTRRIEGPPNAQVCLKSNEAGFLTLLTERIVR